MSILYTCLYYCVRTCFIFFFFQAEDGIRDYKVTGVQTCALPISQAAAHYGAARTRARGRRAALLAVRAGAAWEAAGERDSAAAAFAAARAAGMPSIDAWLRVRLARGVRDTALAVRLLADVPWPAARAVPGARAQALIAAGGSGEHTSEL